MSAYSQEQLSKQAAYSRAYRERHPNAAKEARDRYNLRHPGREAARVKAHSKTPEYRAWLRAWSKSPEQREKNRIRKAKQISTPRGRIENRLRAAMTRTIRRGRGGYGWAALIGYTVADLEHHLERQFLPGMSWENMGEWHIDHIQPLASFTYESPDDPEFRAAWALSNLRPLWATANQIKNAKRELLL